MSTITLFVPRVYCADETGGRWKEKFGNDEMYLGAVYIAAHANRSFDVRTVRARSVGGNFDDKETVNWNRPLFTFDLGDESINPFPKAVVTSLILAEHDSGNGRNDFIEKVAEEFRGKLTAGVIDGIAKAALAAAGVTDDGTGGGGSGGVGGPIVRDHRADPPIVRDHRRGSGGGTRRAGSARTARQLLRADESAGFGWGIPGGVLVGTPTTNPTPTTPAVAGAAGAIVVDALKDWAKDEIKKIVNALISKVSSWAGDDIFPPVLKTIDLSSATHTWNGSPDSPEEIAEFVAHDGKYQVSMFWQLR